MEAEGERGLLVHIHPLLLGLCRLSACQQQSKQQSICTTSFENAVVDHNFESVRAQLHTMSITARDSRAPLRHHHISKV